MKRITVILALLSILTACKTSQLTPSVRAGAPGIISGVVTSDGTPLPGAIVIVTSPAMSGSRVVVTDAQGVFAIVGLPPGQYTVRTELQGLQTLTQSVTLTSTAGAVLVSDLRVSAVAESITVTASSPAQWEASGPTTTFPNPSNAPMPPRRTNSVATAPVTYTYSKESIGYIEPPGKQYAAIEEHGFIEAATAATTTFAIDVDRASYANIRRHLNEGLVPPPDAVRIEEMLNYFTYSYPQPGEEAPFSITTEVAGCPWNTRNRLLRVGIQGRNLDQWRMAPNNLVFLIDVSGSMSGPDRLALLQNAFDYLIDELRAEDRVSIVVYAGAAGLVLPPTSGADKSTIRAAIKALQSGGSTAGGAGIELAYKIARDNFLEHGNNRVILATDGDFNVGVSSEPDLETLIEAKRRTGIFLSVLGVGMGNMQDAKMELLADKGNGQFSYLDSLKEAEKVFRHELTGTLVTIAQDVKVQLEFDPRAVQSYRQIGYENRALANKDFTDDTKDAGELGAGHSVTALFEIVPATNAPGRIGTLRLRWKEPRGTVSTPLVAEMVDEGKSAYEASSDLQFAAAVVELGMLLRDSPHKGTATWDDVFKLARIAQGADLDHTREEFVQIAQRAKALK